MCIALVAGTGIMVAALLSAGAALITMVVFVKWVRKNAAGNGSPSPAADPFAKHLYHYPPGLPVVTESPQREPAQKAREGRRMRFGMTQRDKFLSSIRNGGPLLFVG